MGPSGGSLDSGEYTDSQRLTTSNDRGSSVCTQTRLLHSGSALAMASQRHISYEVSLSLSLIVLHRKDFVWPVVVVCFVPKRSFSKLSELIVCFCFYVVRSLEKEDFVEKNRTFCPVPSN